MTIIINNKPAMLKRGSSFEFISENHFFIDADSYTLSITFPLQGCKQNSASWGILTAKDMLEQRIAKCIFLIIFALWSNIQQKESLSKKIDKDSVSLMSSLLSYKLILLK